MSSGITRAVPSELVEIHPYDICPTGTRNPYTYQDLYLEDDYRLHMSRISKATGYENYYRDHSGTQFYCPHVWLCRFQPLCFRQLRLPLIESPKSLRSKF